MVRRGCSPVEEGSRQRLAAPSCRLPPTAESAELLVAKRRIAELEAELATVERAAEPFDKGGVVRPKDLVAMVETLAAEGHGAKRVCRILRVVPSGFFR